MKTCNTKNGGGQRLSDNRVVRRILYSARLYQKDVVSLRRDLGCYGAFDPHISVVRGKRNAFLDAARLVASELVRFRKRTLRTSRLPRRR